MINITALRLHIIIPKPMKETALRDQFGHFWPLKDVRILEDRVINNSSGPNDVKLA